MKQCTAGWEVMDGMTVEALGNSNMEENKERE
jgi:hypothetical protein